MRIAAWLSYDGEPFSGFARQNDQLTVQGSIEEALELLFRRPIETTCAGRTDAGVHALCQVVSFDLSEDEWLRRKPESLLRSLNALTHEAISLRAIRSMPEGFSARFSATAREYRYHICTDAAVPLLMKDFCWHLGRPLDVRQMEEAASYLLGEHDFKSFCMAASAKGKPTHRYVAAIDLRQERIWNSNFVIITVIGNAFLHSMVRTIVGTLVLVGSGKRSPEWVKDVLQARDRQAAGQNAPAQGLVLWNVSYDEQHRSYDPRSHQIRDGAVLGGTVAELGEIASEEQLSEAIEDVPLEMLKEATGSAGVALPKKDQRPNGSSPSAFSKGSGEAKAEPTRGKKAARRAKRTDEDAAGAGGTLWSKLHQGKGKDREFVIPRGPDLDAAQTCEMPVIVVESAAVPDDKTSQVVSGATTAVGVATAVASFATPAAAAVPAIDVLDAAITGDTSSVGVDVLPLVSDEAVRPMSEEEERSFSGRAVRSADKVNESRTSDSPNASAVSATSPAPKATVLSAAGARARRRARERSQQQERFPK